MGSALEIHHHGTFKEEDGDLLYIDGMKKAWVVDPDELSGFEIVNKLKEMGYKSDLKNVLYRIPGKSLKDGLQPLWNDKSVIQLIGYLTESKHIELYVSHTVDLPFSLPTEEGGDIFEAWVEAETGSEAQEHVEAHIEAQLIPYEADQQTDEGDGSTDTDSDSIPGDVSDNDDLELTQIREQVRIAQMSRQEKLKSLRLQKDSEAAIHVERGNDVVGLSNLDDEGNGTDYASSDEFCSIGEESDEEFGSAEDEDIVENNGVRAKFRKTGTFQRYETESEVPIFSVGQLFDDREQLKNAICLAAVKTQRKLYLRKNCKEFIRAGCKGAGCSKGKCPWKISAGYVKNLGAYQVKTLSDKHTCSVTFKNDRVNSRWLAQHYMRTIRAMPSIKVHEFKMLVKEQLGLEVTKNQCRRAKEKVYDLLVGDSKAEYAMMWDYAEELKRSNDGSSVYMMVERPIVTEPSIFDRFYICFDAVRKGFLKGCRPVIGLDGCFLKNVVRGQLLAAIGRDGNNQMFPLAWAVVQVESRDTWSWFLTLLKEDLGIRDGLGWTFISDQQKGLVPAIAELLPSAEHRMCARHIYANWGGSHKGPKIQQQFWLIAKSTTETDFKKNLQELENMSPQAHEDLLKRPHPKHWCKAFFNPMVKCDIVDNNLNEAFNGRILEARCKTIYSMLEDIRKIVMERIHKQRTSCDKWKKPFGPRIEKKLEENMKLSRYCHVTWNGEDGYEITAWDIKYVVDIRNMTCDCRGWQLTGIPCCHDVSALLDKNLNPDDYVDSYYHKKTFLEAYGTVMQPVRDPKNWKKKSPS